MNPIGFHILYFRLFQLSNLILNLRIMREELFVAFSEKAYLLVYLNLPLLQGMLLCLYFATFSNLKS